MTRCRPPPCWWEPSSPPRWCWPRRSPAEPMHFPRLPDWLIYAVIVACLLVVAIGRQERADAPPAPPPAPEPEGAALGPAPPFDPSVVVEVADKTEPGAGTAFSIAASGVWVTARHVVEGCR